MPKKAIVEDYDDSVRGKIIKVDLDDIIIGPIRKSKEAEFEDLKASIKKDGLKVPPVVQKKTFHSGNFLYRVIPGHGTSRVTACNELNFKRIYVEFIDL